jgi:hypothetical protein
MGLAAIHAGRSESMRRPGRIEKGRRLLVVLAVVAVSGILFGGFVRIPYGQSETVREIMEEKLDHAHGILEALIFEDFDEIEANAAWLGLLAEAAEWHVYQTPDYTRYSTEFFKSVGALGEAAKKKDLEGAAAAYADMTTKCVRCHKYVRGVRHAAVRTP